MSGGHLQNGSALLGKYLVGASDFLLTRSPLAARRLLGSDMV
jgi:hypothetical protein